MAAKRTVEVDVVWDGGMSFVARTDSHHFLTMDTSPAGGGANTGPSPMEIVACALGGCTAMDVVEILNKKRKTILSLNVRVTGKRRDAVPSVFDEIELDYRVRGADLTDSDVRQAIELSVDKYCSVVSMLRPAVRIVPKWTIEHTA